MLDPDPESVIRFRNTASSLRMFVRYVTFLFTDQQKCPTGSSPRGNMVTLRCRTTTILESGAATGPQRAGMGRREGAAEAEDTARCGIG
jgi:hypothetical protein